AGGGRVRRGRRAGFSWGNSTKERRSPGGETRTESLPPVGDRRHLCRAGRRRELLVPEQIALDQRFYQAADAVLAAAGRLEDALDLGTITEAHRGAGRIHRELPDEIAG